MSAASCTRCGRSVTCRQGGSSARQETGEGVAEIICPRCLADETSDVQVAEAGWTKHLAAEIDARDGHPEGSPADGGLEQRVRAELELDPLTAATLIVAEENRRLSE